MLHAAYAAERSGAAAARRYAAYIVQIVRK